MSEPEEDWGAGTEWDAGDDLCHEELVLGFRGTVRNTGSLKRFSKEYSYEI